MSDTMNNIIAITNRKLCRNRSFDEAIDTALEDNVRYIIIREKDLSIQEYIKYVNEIQLHIHNIFPDTQTKIIMNLGNVQNTYELFEIINNTVCRNVHMPVYTLDKLETSDFGNQNSSFNSIRNDIADKNINNINFDETSIYEKEYNKLYNKLSKKYTSYELEQKIKQKLYQKGLFK